MTTRSAITAVLMSVIVSLLATHAHGQTVSAVDDVFVVDATGKMVGRVISFEGPAGATVALKVNDQLIVLRVTRERFIGNADTYLYFESTDCTGTPYVPAGLLSLGPSLTAVVIGPPGITVYLGDPDGGTRLVTSRSQLPSPISGPDGLCQQGNAAPSDALPVTALVDLASMFESPFSLVAGQGAGPVETPTPVQTPTPPINLPCSGDCNDDGSVSIDEILIGAAISLGNADLGECAALDLDSSDRVTVNELVTGVNQLLKGCAPH